MPPDTTRSPVSPRGLNYYENFRTPVGYTFTTQKVGSDRTIDSDPGATGVTDLFTVLAGTTDSTRDAGLLGAAPTFGWAQNLANVNSYYTGNTPTYASLVATDASGNVYVAGTMDGTKDFDNGPGTYNLTATGPATFVAKYSSAGALVWAKGLLRLLEFSHLTIAVGTDGSVYATGAFAGTVDFHSGAALTSQGTQDAFVSKFDAAGNVLWVKDLGGTLGTAGGNGIRGRLRRQART